MNTIHRDWSAFAPLSSSSSTLATPFPQAEHSVSNEEQQLLYSYQDIYSPPASPTLTWLETPTAPSALMRTVYLGGLAPEITLEEILNHVKGGLIEQVRHFPEKNCCFITFLDANVAAGLFSEAQTRRFLIGGCDIKVGWGNQSPIPSNIINAVMNGATRNVFIGNIDESVTEDFLRSEFLQFGQVDHVKILYEKRIAFVHMAGIPQAMKAVSTLQLEPSWMLRRVHYGRDRCAPSGLNPLASLPQNLIGSHLLKNGDPNCLMAPLNSPGNIPNRTIYIGGIHPDVTTKDICDTIRGGILQHIKYMADKNIAFVTFVEAECANQFYDRTQLEGLVFKGKRVKVGWGKATPLPTSVQIAVSQNSASRNVYIGSIDDMMTEEKLIRDFGELGDIELINIIPDKNIAFVNFTDILSAIRAVEVMKNSFEYHRFKINYGKDRCGNIPRSSRVGNMMPASASSFNSSQMYISSSSANENISNSVMDTSFFDNLLGGSSNNQSAYCWGNSTTPAGSPNKASNYVIRPSTPTHFGIAGSLSLDQEYSTMISKLNIGSSQTVHDPHLICRSKSASPASFLSNSSIPNGGNIVKNSGLFSTLPYFQAQIAPIGSNRLNNNSPSKFGPLIDRSGSAPSPW